MGLAKVGVVHTPQAFVLNTLGWLNFSYVSSVGAAQNNSQCIAYLPLVSNMKISKVAVFFAGIDSLAGDLFNIVLGTGVYTQGVVAANDNSYTHNAANAVGSDNLGFPTNIAANGSALFSADMVFNAANFPNASTGLAAPAAPGLAASASGGSLATGTEYVKVTYVNPNGESLPSAEANVPVTGPTGSVTVTSPAASGNATAYNVYASSVTGTETKLNATPIALGANYVITANAAGSSVPAINTTGGGSAVFIPTNYDAVYPAGGVLTLRATTNTGTGSITGLKVAMLAEPLGLRAGPVPSATYYQATPGVDF